MVNREELNAMTVKRLKRMIKIQPPPQTKLEMIIHILKNSRPPAQPKKNYPRPAYRADFAPPVTIPSPPPDYHSGAGNQKKLRTAASTIDKGPVEIEELVRAIEMVKDKKRSWVQIPFLRGTLKDKLAAALSFVQMTTTSTQFKQRLDGREHMEVIEID